jgi:hypothetical protein
VEFTIHEPFEGASSHMTITAILLAAILAGLGSLNVYLTIHGGHTSPSTSTSADSSNPLPVPTPSNVSGGGPVT